MRYQNMMRKTWVALMVLGMGTGLLSAQTKVTEKSAKTQNAEANEKFLIFRNSYEDGTKIRRYLVNGKDRNIVELGDGKSGKALHIKLSVKSQLLRKGKKGEDVYRSLFWPASISPEDGKSYVFKFRMKKNLSEKGRMRIAFEQKGSKDGKPAYFRIKHSDPTTVVRQRFSGNSDWQDYSFEFTPVPSSETECKTSCNMYFVMDGPIGTEAWIDDVEILDLPVIYKSDFKSETTKKPLDWKAFGSGAVLDEKRGSAGKGSLKIRVNEKSESSPYWESDYISVPDPDLFLSCRIMDWLRFSPDPTYNVNLEVLCYDQEKKLIKKYPEFVSVWTGYSPNIGNRLLGGRHFSKKKWHYLSKKMLFPAQTSFLKMRFGFRHSHQRNDIATTGEAWLDDVTLLSGKVMTTDSAGEAYREHAWPMWDNRDMRIHTPVFMNLFLPEDKLAIDITVLGHPEILDDMSDVTLEYSVEDFFHTTLIKKQIKSPDFQLVPEGRLKASGINSKIFSKAIWKQIILPTALVGSDAGRWLKFHCRVLKGEKLIAEGNTNFGVIRPAAPVTEKKKDFSKFSASLHVFSPNWGKCPVAAGTTERPTYAELFGFHWKRGNYINSWASCQPEKNGPINWDKLEVEKLFKSGELKRGRDNRVYICFNSVLPHCRPRWSDLPDQPATRDSLDPEAFAKWVYAVVNRYKGEGIVWVTGFSETAINEKQANLGRVSYEAAKKADPDAIVFCNGVTGMSIERMKKYFELGHLDFTDALDLHFYYAPYATEKTLDYVNAEMKKRGQVKQIWSAEIGSFCRDFETLCKDMVKKHVIAYACGMRNVSWHALGAPQIRKVNPMWRFFYRFPEGKLAGDLPIDATIPRAYQVPLPRMFTLNNLMRDLDYVEPRTKSVSEDGMRTYVFDRNATVSNQEKKETVIAVWQTEQQKEKNMALSTRKPVSVRNAFGVKHQLFPDSSGRVFIPVNDNPRIINVDGQLDKVVFSPGPISIDAPEKISGTEPFEVKVSITNHDKDLLTGQVRIKAGIGWKVLPADAKIKLSANNTKTLIFKVSPPENIKSGKHCLWIDFMNNNGKLMGYDEFYLRR